MTPTEIISSFKQGHANNCASVALCKAAICNYGIDNVYALHAQGGGNNTVTLRDQTELNISDAEFHDLGEGSAFISMNMAGAGQVIAYAKKCFAILVRCYAHKERTSVDSALSHICDSGLNSDYAYRYLGIPDAGITRLEFSDQGRQDLDTFRASPLYLLYNLHHIAIAAYDRYDEYGTMIPLAEFQPHHKKAFRPGKDFWAYTLNIN